MARLGDLLKRGMWAPVRALLPKNPWLRAALVALPVLLLLALFGPAVDVLLKLLDLGMRVLDPLLQTTLGRIALLLVVFTLGGLAAVWLLQGRVRDMRGEAVLGRHLLATARLVGHDHRRSRDAFAKIARYRGPLPQRYPFVVQDAAIKLARLALDQDRVDEGLGWLARVVEPGLPDELLRSLLQLRVRAMRRQGEVLPQTLEQEIASAVERFPDDYGLLRDLRDLHAARGRQADVVAAQERIVKVAPGVSAAAERQRLLVELQRQGAALLDAGDESGVRRIVRRLQQVDRDGPTGHLLLGDLLLRGGDPRGAIKAYGQAQSPTALERIATALDRHPGLFEPRELLEACPLQGTLLLVARELARQGESARAERAARMAAEALGPTPTVCALLSEVLALLGQEDKARLLRQEAITRLLSP